MDTTKIEKNGKIFMIAYDQGLEHGPTDFNGFNYHPNFIFKIALESGASCVAMHYGLAKSSYVKSIQPLMPLILKVNGKSKLYSGNTRSALTGTIQNALDLNAVGIGFTIFPGEKDEAILFEQFVKLRNEAEKEGLITILWSYARGPEIQNQYSTEVVAYAARIAAELGADVAKIKYTGDPESFKWAVKSAVNTKVIASGTDNFEGNYLEKINDMLSSGAKGLAVGRRVWQDADPINLAKQIAAKIYNY